MPTNPIAAAGLLKGGARSSSMEIEPMEERPEKSVLKTEMERKLAEAQETAQAAVFPHRLGPFGISLANSMDIQVVPGASEYTVDEDLMKSTGYHGGEFKVLQNRGPISGMFALDESMGKAERHELGIPRKGTHVAWCGPLFGCEVLEYETLAKLNMGSSKIAFTQLGGFAYFDEAGEFVSTAIIGGGNDMQFKPATKFESKYTAELKSAGRVQMITLQVLLDTGARHFCWIGPGESLTAKGAEDWIPFEKRGGFVYWFADDPTDCVDPKMFESIPREEFVAVAGTLEVSLAGQAPERSWFYQRTYICVGFFPAEPEQQESERVANDGFVLLPSSAPMLLWHTLQFAVTTFIFLEQPMRLAFHLPESDSQSMADLFFDILLFLDMARFFFTAFYIEAQNGQGWLVTSPAGYKLGTTNWKAQEYASKVEGDSDKAVTFYPKRGFDTKKTLCLIVSGLPLDLLLSHVFSLSLKATRCWRLLKLVRVYMLSDVLSIITRAVDALPPNFPITSSHWRLFTTVGGMLAVTHVVAMVLYLVGHPSNDPPGCEKDGSCGWVVNFGWTAETDAQDSNRWERYVCSFYYGFTIMSTVGFGDISAHHMTERIVTILMMLAGVFGFGVVMGSISQIIDERNTSKNAYNEKRHMLQVWMDFSHVSAEVQDQVRGFYEYAYPQRELFDLDELLADLPQTLQNDINRDMYGGVILAIPFVPTRVNKMAQASVIRSIRDDMCNSLTIEHFMANTDISHQGKPSDVMYIVQQGEVGVYLDEICFPEGTQRKGDVFGEFGLFVEAKRHTTVTSLTFVRCIMLSREKLRPLLVKYPQYYDACVAWVKRSWEQGTEVKGTGDRYFPGGHEQCSDIEMQQAERQMKERLDGGHQPVNLADLKAEVDKLMKKQDEILEMLTKKR